MNSSDRRGQAVEREQRAEQAQERGAQGDVFGKCCIDPAEEPFYSPVLQERAWTSAIWVNPAEAQ